MLGGFSLILDILSFIEICIKQYCLLPDRIKGGIKHIASASDFYEISVILYFRTPGYFPLHNHMACALTE